MTVAKLCTTVSGWYVQSYLAQVRQNHEWADTAFVHALGRAYGVDVLIFQEHADEALVGEDVMEDDSGLDKRAAIMVPIAWVNDYHFWGGVVECEPEVPIPPVDK
eukprot:8693143-Lingulodinium_polyedra.AAC.1